MGMERLAKPSLNYSRAQALLFKKQKHGEYPGTEMGCPIPEEATEVGQMCTVYVYVCVYIHIYIYVGALCVFASHWSCQQTEQGEGLKPACVVIKAMETCVIRELPVCRGLEWGGGRESSSH